MPPEFFKLGTLELVDHNQKIIKIDVSKRIPVGNCGDGVAVNNKAARILSELYGIESPSKFEIVIHKFKWLEFGLFGLRPTISYHHIYVNSSIVF